MLVDFVQYVSLLEILPNVADFSSLRQFATGDQFLTTLTMSYANRYRNVGIFVAYIAFNVFLVFLCTYLFTIVDWAKIGKKSKVAPVIKENSEKSSSSEEKQI